MKRGAFAAAVLVLTACGGVGAGLGLGPKPVEEKPAPQPTSINLDRADPAETLSVAEQLLEEPVLVDAMALASLRCIRVTVKEPVPQPRRVAAESLFDALRAQGLRVDRAGGMWLVSIDKAHPPAACEPEGRQTAASEADAGAVAMDGDAGPEAASPYDPESVLREVLRSIREISPTEHAITQRGLELFLDNEPALLRSARIVPEVVAGKPVGIRLFGIRADELLGRLGFENGDRVDRLMGKPLATPEQALEAYAAMRGAKVIEIEIVRRGAPKKLLLRVE
jgi:hypothetical protein